MVLSMVAVGYASKTTAHTITVTTHGVGAHTYGAYQIFKGNLDASGTKMSDIEWGAAMPAAKVTALATAIAADNSIASLFASCTTPEDYAKVLDANKNTASVAQAFADAVNTALNDDASPSPTAQGTTNSSGVASINVTGDGYYFIKDIGTIEGKDTASRFVLQVVNNINVTAKDTVLTPDKEIVNEDGTAINPGVKDNDSSIGDVITFNVTIPVPDTTQYKDHFILQMNDTLDAGLTYFGNMAITINTDPVTTLTEGTQYYAPTVKTGETAFTVPGTPEAAVTTTGGQTIKVIFKDFKTYREANNNAWAGKTITISYQAVLNQNATYGVEPNKNDVYFEYSNNPNHDYDGDNFGPDEPKGTTPHSITKTFVTTLELDKVDGADTTHALAGAEFELTGTSWNNVLVTGEKFVEAPYTQADAATGETVQSGTYYLLADGTYTTTASTPQTEALYANDNKTYVKVTFSKVVRQAENVSLTLITDENGHIKVEGIEQGTYTLKETKAPAGYNLDTTTYTLVVGWSNPDADNASQTLKDAGGFYKADGSNALFEMDSNGARFHITITNNGGQTLPSTGGIGTTLFYVGGGILVLAAIILLVTKKRMSAND